MAFKINTVHRDEFMSHVSESVQRLVKDTVLDGTSISLEFYSTMFLNSYEQKFIEAHLSDEALAWKIDNAMKNRGLFARIGPYDLPKHYDHYLLSDGIDELFKRFKELIRKRQ